MLLLQIFVLEHSCIQRNQVGKMYQRKKRASNDAAGKNQYQFEGRKVQEGIKKTCEDGV